MRREAAIEYLRGALWAMPTAAVFLALIAGSVLSSITIESGSSLSPLVFQGTVDDARNLLIGIASTMVTVIALVLGLTVVALQLASTQFSPRLLRNFLRDLVNQLTLSSFVPPSPTAPPACTRSGSRPAGVRRTTRASPSAVRSSCSS